jgi:hypothetical protein
MSVYEKKIFFTQNQFFKFYDSELSDKEKLITHIWSLISRECNPKVS